MTLVDAVNWPGTSEEHEESVRQVALADQIRITKLDMVTGDRQDGLSRIRLDVRRINPSAEIAEVDWSSSAVAKLLTFPGFDMADPQADTRPWLNVQAYQKPADDLDACGEDHHHHEHDHARPRAQYHVFTRPRIDSTHYGNETPRGHVRDALREAARSFELYLLRQRQSIVDFDPELTDGALNLRMSEKQLDRSQVAGLAVDLSRLGATQRMCAIRLDPDAGLPCVVSLVEPTGSETHLIAHAGQTEIVAVLKERLRIREDETIRLSFAVDQAHFFDPNLASAWRPTED